MLLTYSCFFVIYECILAQNLVSPFYLTTYLYIGGSSGWSFHSAVIFEMSAVPLLMLVIELL